MNANIFNARKSAKGKAKRGTLPAGKPNRHRVPGGFSEALVKKRGRGFTRKGRKL